MKNRVISGIGYVVVLLGFYLLKIFVHDFFFDALIYAFALIGTFEILRAMKEHTTKAERGIVITFAIVTIPACAVVEEFVQFGLHVTCICFFALAIALLSLLVLRHEETNPDNLGISFLSAVYPSLLLCLLVLTNHVDPATMRVSSERLAEIGFNSDLLILMIFVVSPVSDTLAFLFGKFLGKFFPAKMAP
ncbi:MAG: phosphatidate cytidylyltransferase, partial [Clostridia bacterium]|nr:phosphatidate cytidylyltransferase [Clostridia bacterium]